MKRDTTIIIALLIYSISISTLFFQDILTETQSYSSNPIYDITINGVIRDVQRQSDGNDLVTVEVSLAYKEEGRSYLQDISVQEGDFVEVISLRQNKICRMDFVVDQRYIIYSLIKGENFLTHACWGTHPYEKSGSISHDDTVHPVPWENP